MHIAEIRKPVTFAGARLEPGDYLVDDATAGNLLVTAGALGGVRLRFAGFVSSSWPVPREGAMTVVHPGGFGDLLWLNAVYDRLRERGVKVRHAAFPAYAPVLKGFVDEVLPYPLPFTEEDEVSAMIGCIRSVEYRVSVPPCVDEHPGDRFARAFGLEPVARKAAYCPMPDELQWARERWPRGEKRRVAVQAESSVGVKGYPHLAELLGHLLRSGWEVLVVGAPAGRDTRGDPPTVLDCKALGLPIREQLALAACCDACAGADSMLIHFAHAMDLPAVGLFGPFAGAAYMAGYRGKAVQGRAPCSPCSLSAEAMKSAGCAGRECGALRAVPSAEVAAILNAGL